MPTLPQTADNPAMTQDDIDDLYDHAVDLAAHAFGDLNSDQVEWLHKRLVWNAERGLGDDGAVTVH